jgi:hypothetical protein
MECLGPKTTTPSWPTSSHLVGVCQAPFRFRHT